MKLLHSLLGVEFFFEWLVLMQLAKKKSFVSVSHYIVSRN